MGADEPQGRCECAENVRRRIAAGYSNKFEQCDWCKGLEAKVAELTPRSVVAAVIQNDGRYLIGKRKLKQWMGGRWCFVGGKVETGESLKDAVIREVSEELGISVIVGRLMHEQIEAYKNGTWHLHYFDCLMGNPMETPTALGVSDFEWVLPSELPGYDLLPVDIDIAKRLDLEHRLAESQAHIAELDAECSKQCGYSTELEASLAELGTDVAASRITINEQRARIMFLNREVERLTAYRGMCEELANALNSHCGTHSTTCDCFDCGLLAKYENLKGKI